MKRRQRQELSLKECYDILNLKKSASLEEVKHAYRLRAFELHPDLNPGNPDAGIAFQTLNEAYVLLSDILKTEEAKFKQEARGDASKEEAKRKAEAESAAKEQEEKAAREKAQEERAEKEKKEQEAEKQATEKENAAKKEESHRKRAAESAYGQNDTLRDLLNDPFARRVFEDIYSEINRQGAENAKNNQPLPDNNQASPPPPETKRKSLKFEWGDDKASGLNFKNGVSGAVKGWLRNQIDEEQTFKLPRSKLFPGARIRLRIRRGFSEELTTIEIVLPRDFTLGKPIRLRGLGKKVGPWQGDMYLKFEAI